MTFLRFFALAAVAWVAFAPVHAQDYPSRPVRIVVGFAAGSASDLIARARKRGASAADAAIATAASMKWGSMRGLQSSIRNDAQP